MPKCYCCPDEALYELTYKKSDGTLYEEKTYSCIEDLDSIIAVSNLNSCKQVREMTEWEKRYNKHYFPGE